MTSVEDGLLAPTRASLTEWLDRFLRVADRPDAAVLLWRWDPAQQQLILEHCRTSTARGNLEPLRHTRVSATWRSIAAAVDPRRHAALTAWMRTGGWNGRHILTRPLPSGGNDVEGNGLLQLVGDEPFGPDVVDAFGRFAVQIARAIDQEGEQSLTTAFRPLLMLVGGRTLTRNEWLEAAAKAVRIATGASAAAIFTYRPDLRLGLAASDPRPTERADVFVTSRAYPAPQIVEASGVMRLRDFQDPGERRQAFGDGNYDEEMIRRLEDAVLHGPIRAWMSCPVMFDQSLAAVVVLLNKTGTLSEEFTPVDVDVTAATARFLTGTLPSVMLPQAIAAMAEWSHHGTLSDPVTRTGLFRLFSDTLPGFVAAVLKRVSPNGDEYEVRIGVLPDDAAASPSSDRTSRGLYSRSFSIPKLTEDQSSLTILLRRPTLDPYEEGLVGMMCRELSHLLLEEELLEARRSFVQVRHALRAVITPITGYAHEAASTFAIHQRTCGTGKVLQDRIAKALSRLSGFASTAHNVLEQARFLLGQIIPENLQLQLCDLSELIDGVVRSLRPLSDRRDIRLQFVSGRCEARIDRDLMHIALFNVIDNAVKYSRRSRPVLIELQGGSRGWLVNVTSFGAPVPEDVAAGRFKPFTRAVVEGTDEPVTGTGLGLAVAEAIVTSHHGKILVRSEAMPGDPSVARTRVTLSVGE